MRCTHLTQAVMQAVQGVANLLGAVSGAAEVTWVVIAVGLMLGLQPGAKGGIGGGGAIILHTCDCTILGSGATCC